VTIPDETRRRSPEYRRADDSGADEAPDPPSEPHTVDAGDVLDRLPFGVLVFDAATFRCTYRNLLGARWGAARGDLRDDHPWDDGHLSAVATKLRGGSFTEPLPRDPSSASPPAEVRWDALRGRLLATVRDLSEAEGQRMVLDELHLDEVAEGVVSPQLVMLPALCWDIAEAVAGDRRPLGVDVHDAEAAVFGDPELLRAAVSQLVTRSTGGGDDSTPVTLRLMSEERSVLVQVDELEPSPRPTGDGADHGLALVRRLAAVHGGELKVLRLGSTRRTQLELPRALPRPH
jgi:hypothetical protein